MGNRVMAAKEIKVKRQRKELIWKEYSKSYYINLTVQSKGKMDVIYDDAMVWRVPYTKPAK